MVMSNFTPLLLFGVNVELSALLSVSFNIDLLCGPWSIGHGLIKVIWPEPEPLAWFSQGPRGMMLL